MMVKQANKSLSNSDVSKDLSPVELTQKQKWICLHLDALNRLGNFCPNAKPSDLIKGALHSMRHEERKVNPDWMSQAAHSLRDIMYGIRKVAVLSGKKNEEKTKGVFKLYQGISKSELLGEKLYKLNKIFTTISHHYFDEKENRAVLKLLSDLGVAQLQSINEIDSKIFENLVLILENIWVDSIPQQLEIHEKIDSLLNIQQKKNSKEFLNLILSFNSDSYNYFFAKIDSNWLNWLQKNGFFEILKQKAVDPSRYGYNTPELKYLVRIAQDDPKGVVKVIKDTPISLENFNPEVIDQFLHICAELPADALSSVVNKIKEEKWSVLMSPFSQWGFEYEKMFQTLKESKNNESILILFEAILCIRKQSDKDLANKFNEDNPFYFSELESTGVFKYLTEINEGYLEQVLKICTDALREIILFGGLNKKRGTFKYKETFELLDVDLFDLELGGRHISYRDNIRELVAVIKVVIERLFNVSTPKKVHEIFEEFIANLPENDFIWRFKLFVMNLQPSTFRDELRKAFMRLFIQKDYNDIISGTEYRKTLQSSFGVLPEQEKKSYVTKAIAFFNKDLGNNDEKKWLKQDGNSVFSMITNHLSKTEMKKIEAAGFKINNNYKPQPAIGTPTSGFISPRAPITNDDFNKLSAEEIAKKLRLEWSPDALRKMNSSDDFMKPLNAEGISNLLKEGISNRLKEFLAQSHLFFERDVLDRHYTYVFLSSIEDVMSKDGTDFSGLDFGPLVSLLCSIEASGKSQPFNNESRDRNTFDSWLASWQAVHASMAELVEELLRKRKNSIVLDFKKHRSSLLGVIEYLLSHPDPTPKDEEIKTAVSKTSSAKNANYVVSDPYTIAVNTVRGKAFKALIQLGLD